MHKRLVGGLLGLFLVPLSAFSAVTVVLTILFVLALFNIVPALIASLLLGALAVDSLLAERLVDGALQIAILIAYLSLAGRSRDIDRTYRYHGGWIFHSGSLCKRRSSSSNNNRQRYATRRKRERQRRWCARWKSSRSVQSCQNFNYSNS